MTVPEPTTPDTAAAPRPRVSRWRVSLLVGLTLSRKVGEAASPALLVHWPLVLVALNPEARYLLLAGRSVGVAPLMVVALARRMLAMPIIYTLGATHGTGVLSWFDARFRRVGRLMRAVERWFRRWPSAVVVLYPGALTAFLAGDASMPRARFLGLTAVGISLRLGFTMWLGARLARPLDAVLSFVGNHQWELTAATLGLTLLNVLYHRHRGRPAALAPDLTSPGAG